MNEILQKHGCSNVFTVPEGLKELMSDITREVLREQPKDIYDFISNYLSVLLITREHGVMAVRILEELCDCRPSVSEHLLQLGLEKDTAQSLAQVIKDEIENFEPSEEKEKIKESKIVKKILARAALDEDMAAKVCQIARNAYKDYWYKKKLMAQGETMRAEEAWEVAAERTLALYKKTKPSLSELNRATERIQAAYKGYHVRRNLLNHLKPRAKSGPKEALPGPPLDIAGSREIHLGPVIDIQVKEDNVNSMFEEQAVAKLGLAYDPTKTITNVEDHSENVQDAGKYPKTQADGAKNLEIRVVHVDSGRKDFRDAIQSTFDKSELDSYNEEKMSRDEDNVLENRPPGGPGRKISFATVPPELIPNDYDDDDWEVQEAIQEVFDEIGPETIQEIPEDIPDQTIDDDKSTPVASTVSLISTDGHDDVM